MSTWTRGFAKMTKEMVANGDVVMKKVTLACFQGVTSRSPVDKGTFRANWNVAVNDIDDSVNADVTQDISFGAGPSPLEMDNVREALQRVRLGDIVNITNNLPYAEPLEQGHSPQNQQMMAKTVNEVADRVNRGAIKA